MIVIEVHKMYVSLSCGQCNVSRGDIGQTYMYNVGDFKFKLGSVL